MVYPSLLTDKKFHLISCTTLYCALDLTPSPNHFFCAPLPMFLWKNQGKASYQMCTTLVEDSIGSRPMSLCLDRSISDSPDQQFNSCATGLCFCNIKSAQLTCEKFLYFSGCFVSLKRRGQKYLISALKLQKHSLFSL